MTIKEMQNDFKTRYRTTIKDIQNDYKEMLN